MTSEARGSSANKKVSFHYFPFQGTAYYREINKSVVWKYTVSVQTVLVLHFRGLLDAYRNLQRKEK